MENIVLDVIKEEKDFTEKYIDNKLRNRMRFFVLLYLVMVSIMVFDVYKEMISLTLLSIGVILGIFVGMLVGRIFDIQWNPKKEKVVMRLDKLGLTILILYGIFTIFRHQIFAQFLEGVILSAFVYSFASGAILGRLLSMRRKIKKIVDDKVNIGNI